MHSKLLAVLAGTMSLAPAQPLPPAAMTIDEWASGCGNAEGVEARNVGEGDNPQAALDKAALEMCRSETKNAAVAYSIVYKQAFNDNDLTLVNGKLVPLANPKVVRWTIRCRNPNVAAASSASNAGSC